MLTLLTATPNMVIMFKCAFDFAAEFVGLATSPAAPALALSSNLLGLGSLLLLLPDLDRANSM